MTRAHGNSGHGSKTRWSRRELIAGAGTLVVGFAIGLDPARMGAQQTAAPPPPTDRTLDPKAVDSFLVIHRDGSITIYTSKVDVGTGMRIAMAQMAAEELGVSTARITIVDGDTARCPNHGGTGGSTGLTRGGTGIRQAAATARQALLSLAATALSMPASALTIENGEVRAAAPTARGKPRAIGIGALVGDRRFNLQVDASAPLVPSSRYRIVGTSPARPDVPAKCTGQYTYVQDVRVPGMLHARVIRPPAIGATLIDVDETSIKSIPGVRVVRIESFLAVVAKGECAAVRAAKELTARWTEWQGLPGHEALDQQVRDGVVEREQTIVDLPAMLHIAAPDDIERALAGGSRRFAATYFWPCQSHASLGPSCAVADIRDGGGTVWTSSQVTYGLRATLARVFGLRAEALRLVFVEGSGSYGTNGADHAAADAVLLSKTLGEPVRVQWSREDELGWDPKGPQQLLELRAAVADDGTIRAWDTQMWIPANHRGARILLAAQAAGLPQDSGRDAAAIFENGDPPYELERVRVHAHWLRDTPLNPSNLRAPGKPANVFAVESFCDEIAAGLGVDPLAFRTRRLTDSRALDALAQAAKAFGWDPRPSPNPKRQQGDLLVGRGLAYVRYKGKENYVATFMEVAVDPARGRIAVRHVVCAHDCGLVVNPDALRNQIEGAIVQTLSRAIHEEVTFDRARVTSVNWSSYPILRLPETPHIDVILIDRPDQPLWGAGEAAAVPVAAALGNAFFDATGVRMRRVPLTLDRVKAALASARQPI